MTEIVQFGLLGLGVGAAYALTAQGMVLIYRGSGVLNFAQGALGLIGAYVYFEVREEGLSLGFAIVVGVAASAIAGALTQLLVMRQLRGSTPLTRLVATLGVLTLIQGAATSGIPFGIFEGYGDKQEFVGAIFPSGTFEPIEGATVGNDRVYLFLVAVVLTAALWAFYRFTRFGLVTSAVAENEEAAATLGRSPDTIAMINWAAGAAVGGLAAILVLPIIGLSVVQLALLVIPALAAALVGGFVSFPLTLLGATVIGVLESELTNYVSYPGWAKSVPFLVIVVTLVVRGRALPIRGHVFERLPSVGTGLVRPVMVGLLVVGTALVIGIVNVDWVTSIETTAVIAIIALSLIVVSGYAGQLSLAQFALAGIGAWIASGGIDSLGILPFDITGVSFPLAILLGVVLTIPVGLLVALPALRTRGVNLAVITLGLALVIERLILSNPDLTGGLEGTIIDPPSLFGFDIDALNHPERYAIFCVVMAALAAWAVANVRRGRTGRRLVAVRTNERAAASLGISVFGAKLYAFGLAAGIAALGGILLAFRGRHVAFEPYGVLQSIQIIVLTVIGGIGWIFGALNGASLAPGAVQVFAIDELIPDVEKYVPLISGLVLILFVIHAPDGLGHDIATRMKRFRRRPEPAIPLGSNEDSHHHQVRAASLVVEDVRVTFGGVVAVDQASLRVPPGVVTGLIGPNGAGKTTIVDVITGFTRPDTGRIMLDDERIDGLAPHRRARAGIARSFQSLELFEDITVLDNLRTASDGAGAQVLFTDLVKPGKQPLSEAGVAAVRGLGLEADLSKRPRDLPYGRRRLVAIARALATSPSVLLLDEPAAGLDETESAEFGALIVRLAHEWGIGILLIEHDVGLVMATCDHVVVMDFGRVIAQGTPDEVRTHPAVVAAYLGPADGEDVDDVSADDKAPSV